MRDIQLVASESTPVGFGLNYAHPALFLNITHSTTTQPCQCCPPSLGCTTTQLYHHTEHTVPPHRTHCTTTAAAAVAAARRECTDMHVVAETTQAPPTHSHTHTTPRPVHSKLCPSSFPNPPTHTSSLLPHPSPPLLHPSSFTQTSHGLAHDC
eukprot:163817-Chlamydomonas_euryale.AAC.1